MTHLLVIALMVVAAVRELGPPELIASAWVSAHPASALLAALLPLAGLVLLQLLVSWRCVRRLDRRGDVRAIGVFERVSAWVRLATLPLHASAVFVFGWLDAVRGWIGDVVAVDEVVAVVPAVVVLLVTWATAEPVERRVREALLIRRLDEGLVIPPMPRALTWWWGTVCQQLLFAALPVVAIMSWSELVSGVGDGLWERTAARDGWLVEPPGWTAAAPDWLLDGDVIAYGSAGLQLVGVVGLLAFLPVALRHLWDTRPLGEGPMRDGLLALCARYGVRVRGILVWRTHGAMVNGAVVGFVPRLRYIVLTDTLLESLPTEQVEAVAAHEIAHARHRHIPWLAGSMVASGVFLGAATSLGARGLGVGPVTDGWAPVSVVVSVFASSLLIFGWASRRFEWQADVFAAQHLSRQGGEVFGWESQRSDSNSTQGARLVSARGASAMSGALGSVSMINGFPADRFTFRHGSINSRRRRLAEAVGEPVVGGRADRSARRVKLIVLGLGVAGVAITAVETVLGG